MSAVPMVDGASHVRRLSPRLAQRVYAGPMGLQQAIYDAFLQGANQFHRAVLALSGGRLMSTVSGMPAVELHTTGRNSGQRRSVMLTAPVYEPTRVVLVASKGGDDRDPEWYRNLVANPDVELGVRGRLARCGPVPPPMKNGPSCGRRSSRRIAATTPTSGAPTARSLSSSSNHADRTLPAPPVSRRPNNQPQRRHYRRRYRTANRTPPPSALRPAPNGLDVWSSSPREALIRSGELAAAKSAVAGIGCTRGSPARALVCKPNRTRGQRRSRTPRILCSGTSTTAQRSRHAHRGNERAGAPAEPSTGAAAGLLNGSAGLHVEP